MKMLARVGDNGFPILQPSTCLYNLPLKLNTVPLVILSRRCLKIAWESNLGQFVLFVYLMFVSFIFAFYWRNVYNISIVY